MSARPAAQGQMESQRPWSHAHPLKLSGDHAPTHSLMLDPESPAILGDALGSQRGARPRRGQSSPGGQGLGSPGGPGSAFLCRAGPAPHPCHTYKGHWCPSGISNWETDSLHIQMAVRSGSWPRLSGALSYGVPLLVYRESEDIAPVACEHPACRVRGDGDPQPPSPSS